MRRNQQSDARIQTKRIEVQRGIYRDKEGALYELITLAASAEDFEPLVIYRELFWVTISTGLLRQRPSLRTRT